MTPTPTPEPSDQSVCRCICTKCGHVWNPKTGKPPRRCPKCRRTWWQLPPWDSNLPTTGAELPSIPRETLRLPNTSPGNRRNHFTFCRVLTAVNSQAWNGSGFDGTLFEPGARVSADEIRAHPVVLEFAGPQGNVKEKRQKHNLWILWKYDWEAREFQELTRAVAHNWNWAVVLRGPAIQALEPRLEAAADPRERAGLVLEQILAAIDSALGPEPQPVKALVLSAVYDRISGRLARLD